MPTLKLPDQEYLKTIIDYSIVTGISHYLRRSGSVSIGDTVNGPHIRIDGVCYKYSRIVWKLVTGEDPEELVDHRDGNNLNNSWLNLRAATHQQNQWNKIGRRGSLTGHKGVTISGSKYVAQICKAGKRRILGRFYRIENAILVYQVAAEELFGEFAVDQRPLTIHQDIWENRNSYSSRRPGT